MNWRLALVLAVILLAGIGCSRKTGPVATRSAAKDQSASQDRSHRQASSTQRSATTSHSSLASVRGFSATDNPTTRAGRGEPSLEDQTRPAAWVLVDGKEGEFVEKDGIRLLQWFIREPVSRTPTIRVEVIENLLGAPTNFACALQTYESSDGAQVMYAMRSADGAFRIGREYSLVDPGAQFTILDKLNNENLTTIPALPPGTYGLAAKIHNPSTGKEALAVTYFTVE